MKGKSSLFDDVSDKSSNSLNNFSNSASASTKKAAKQSDYADRMKSTSHQSSYKNKKGEKLLAKAKTFETKNLIKSLYRNKAKKGDGSTAYAIKREISTGEKVGGKSHIKKGEQSIKAIDNILKKNPNHPDKKMLKSERKKLLKALNTKKGGK